MGDAVRALRLWLAGLLAGRRLSADLAELDLWRSESAAMSRWLALGSDKGHAGALLALYNLMCVARSGGQCHRSGHSGGTGPWTCKALVGVLSEDRRLWERVASEELREP